MNALLTEVSRMLDANGRAIDALVSGVSAEVAAWIPEPGKWSINEVLGHLADEERNDFRRRIDYSLNRPGEAWPPIHPDRMVREGRFNERSLDELRFDFLNERRQSLAWLSGLHDADWSASHHHPEFGPLTAANMLCAWAAHDLLHLRQIERTLFQRLGRATEPDRVNYAGEW